MSNLRLHLSDPIAAPSPAPFRKIGHHLLMDGAISSTDLARGLDLQGQLGAPLGEILIDEGVLTRPEMLQALARQYNAQLVDLDATPPAPRLARKVPAALCLRHRVVPWLQVDDVLLVATATPAGFDAFKAEMTLLGMQILPVIADETAIIRQLERLFGQQRALEAAQRVPPWQSCRSWQIKPIQRRLWAGAYWPCWARRQPWPRFGC